MTQMEHRLARARRWRGVRTVTRAEVRTPILQAVKASVAVAAAWAWRTPGCSCSSPSSPPGPRC